MIEVEAFSLNRGELALLAACPHGWQPGQDIAGRVAASAAPDLAVGTRVVGLVAGGDWSEQVIADVDEMNRPARTGPPARTPPTATGLQIVSNFEPATG